MVVALAMDVSIHRLLILVIRRQMLTLIASQFVTIKGLRVTALLSMKSFLALALSLIRNG